MVGILHGEETVLSNCYLAFSGTPKYAFQKTYLHNPQFATDLTEQREKQIMLKMNTTLYSLSQCRSVEIFFHNPSLEV